MFKTKFVHCLFITQSILKYLGDQKVLSQVLINIHLFSQCENMLRLINNDM